MTDTTTTGPSADAGAGPDRGTPGLVITGVTPPYKLGHTHTNSAGVPEFDWYAATVLGQQPDEVVDALADNLDADVKEGRPLHGYTHAFDLVRPEGVAARVLSGGANGAPHAFASGADAARYAEVVRALWPDDHRVSRMDSRIDFGGVGDSEEIWDTLYAICIQVAEDRRLKTSLAGDYIGKEAGRTLYVGSKKSNVYIRLYEKGKQLRGQMRDDVEARKIPTDWVRIEIQVRPKDEARWDAARSTPAEAWGYSDWTRNLAAQVAGLDVPQVTMQVKRETDDERALAWVGRQYGPMLIRLAESDGWEKTLDRLMVAAVKAQRG